MQTAIAAVIDISQHITAEKGSLTNASYAEAIEHLGELKIFPEEFASSFARVAKLRNVMVHLYDNINFDLIWSLVPNLIKDSSQFIKYLDKAGL